VSGPTPLPITGRPIRLAIVGLGQISELVIPPYLADAAFTIVGLCDARQHRLDRWSADVPEAVATTVLDELLEVDADVVDVLVPTPAHGEVAVRVLDAGFHVQVQKPIARSLEECDRMIGAVGRTGAVLRVLEDYLFFPPLAQLQEVVRSGDIGEPVGVHMKIVATGRGGWDIPMSSMAWQFEQALDGRGMLVFDHGWHQLALARSLFGPVARIFAWIGATQPAPELAPQITLDAPSTLVWEHTNGVRGVLDITLAPDMYFRSDFYTGDERVEVTGTRGYVRCNRISACGVQEPSVVVYSEGETRSFHALGDTLPAGFRASAAHCVDVFTHGERPVMGAEQARSVLAALEAAIQSAATGTVVPVVGG
jgi:predicted dehydrogenase